MPSLLVDSFSGHSIVSLLAIVLMVASLFVLFVTYDDHLILLSL